MIGGISSRQSDLLRWMRERPAHEDLTASEIVDVIGHPYDTIGHTPRWLASGAHLKAAMTAAPCSFSGTAGRTLESGRGIASPCCCAMSSTGRETTRARLAGGRTGAYAFAIPRPREGWYLVAETDATKGPQRLGRTRLGCEEELAAMLTPEQAAARLALLDEKNGRVAAAAAREHDLRAQLASVQRKLAAAHDHIQNVETAKKEPLTPAVMDELLRLRGERDEYRQAARDADGQRLALQRRLATT